MIKNILKKLSIRANVYENIRWSGYYTTFLKIKNSPYRRGKKAGREFLRKLIRPGVICFDIGANVGEITDTFLSLGARKVIAVEPDRKNIRILNLRFQKNKRVEIVGMAVSDRHSTERIYVEKDGSAFNTLSDKWKKSLETRGHERFEKDLIFRSDYEVSTVTLDSLISEHGKPDVIKIDVEGFELQALQGLNQRIPLIWFEVNLPEFLRESQQCVRRLDILSSGTVFNYTTNVLYNDSVEFCLKEWIGASAMMEILEKTNHRFMEIYAKDEKERI